MATAPDELLEPPRTQYIEAQRVMIIMGRAAVRRIMHLAPWQVFLLAMTGGFFIGMGALTSILLASGVGTRGTARLLEGFGFSAGFFFVIRVHAAQMYGPDDARLLNEVIGLKLQFRAIGGAEGWFKAVLSGVFANWLVGLAAFFATMGRSLAASTGERSEPGPWPVRPRTSGPRLSRTRSLRARARR